jgi:hypothetical protein
MVAACVACAESQPMPALIDGAGLRQLLTVRRVYVDRLTGNDSAAQMRDLLIGSLERSKLFILTENPDRADAVLRGAAEDMVFNETHNSSESLDARVAASTGKGSAGSRSSSAGFSVGQRETDHSSERRHEALAAVRLVNKDGDVIWSTTQESMGAKFRGASADVAEKITAKLKEDFERARKLP